MPLKKKKKSTGSGKKKAKTGTGKKKTKKAGGKKKGKKRLGSAKKAPPVPDPFSYAAMLNAYYIAHGPVQFLEFRGYKWSGGGTKKKKGKKKK